MKALFSNVNSRCEDSGNQAAGWILRAAKNGDGEINQDDDPFEYSMHHVTHSRSKR
jgi:hypothetical protein